MYNIKKLNAISGVVYDYLPKDNYNISDDIENADAFLVRSADCHSIEFPENLAAIARAGAGVNNIPIDKCTKEGIVVFNTPGANANGVKELVLCGMLIASRNVIEASKWAETLKGEGDAVGKLVEKGKKQFVGPELKGKTIGVIGLGAIGILVANAAAAIGMDVIGYDPYLSVDNAWTISTRAKRAQKLDELLENSDYITIHVPFMESTKNYISAHEFSKMKKGAILLNFARGGLIDNKALFDAMKEGVVAKYVTDFPSDDMLCKENIICIPHLGASTPESEENCAVMAANELRDFFETGSIVHSVNMPDCQMGPVADRTRVTVIHLNEPNMVSQITNCFASNGKNIDEMVNKSRGEVAYTVLSIDGEVEDKIIADLEAVKGVVRVRKIEK